MTVHLHLPGPRARRIAPAPNVGSARASAGTRPGAVWRDPSHGFADAERPSTPPISLLRTGRLLQRHASCPCGGSCPRCAQHAAASGLRMSEPGDPCERQADRVAEQIMQASPAVVRRPDAATPTLPRRGDPSGAPAAVAPAIVGQALSSPARPLEPQVRAVMEQGFGHDLGVVRIHDGPVAAAAARSVGADAFTVGDHIVFDAGQYRPSQGEGRRLLAHELTHVLQQSGGTRPALRAQRSRFSREADTPSVGFTCTLQEMADPNFDGRSCCDERLLGRLRTMVNDARAHMRTAIERIDGGASIDALLRLHFGPSGPSLRATILGNIRTTLGVADAFLSHHTFLCRPLSDEFGCHGAEDALADRNTDITVCLGGGTITFDWATILHEMFHVSGVADLHVYGETATETEVAAGEFETYYDPQGAEVEDPRWRRYPSAAPLRNADSYRRLVEAVSADNFDDAQPSARFAPTLAAGFGFQLPDMSPTIMARVAFTPLGRGLHFIMPGAVGFWSPTLGVLPSTDPAATQARGYVGGEIGARLVTGSGPVAGVFDLAAGAGAAWTRSDSVDPAAMVRGSAGVRFGGPSFGASVNADLMRIFDFALENQRTDGWILGLSGGLHWGGHSGAPR